ncbi:Hsp20/alpha crystallin family protein [Pararcticibacter amylolyticus]|uniref:Hsp20/alpha crystallin family protein n=1 Tax=Pararcticibacter amylolyticus TaxID=2173175 RepID=A0A2U2PL14_9SPHI|nr:Hsp20/alpha crystallin family protein [Pararcticibacter amylolyticus]PWG82095.1 Hsp20/alpha crystallin family protein [Pararcticibacter amylolyticus]
MTLVKFANGNNGTTLKPWFNDVFDSFFHDSYVSDRLTSKVPAVNISETENQFHIELAAPGLKKEDFRINLDKNVLSISAEKKAESTNESRKYSRREYSYTSFVRSFTLPESADAGAIEAEYIDGVLKVNVTKKEEAKLLSREISVK